MVPGVGHEDAGFDLVGDFFCFPVEPFFEEDGDGGGD